MNYDSLYLSCKKPFNSEERAKQNSFLFQLNIKLKNEIIEMKKIINNKKIIKMKNN